MNCAITGSSGVLGSYIIQNNPKVNFLKFKGDITNKKEITNWILKNNFDAFLHLAAIVPTSEISKNYFKTKKVNYNGTKNIVDALLFKKNIWFFYASSSHVYSSSSNKIRERSELKPITLYGKLKYISELYILEKLEKSKISYCIGRIFSFTFFGQKESFLVPSIFKKNIILSNSFITFKNTNHFRDFVSISDINRAIFFLLKKKANGIFNIGSGKKINLNLLVKKICKIFNNIPVFKKNHKTTYLVANITKIKKLGWRPKDNINDILKDYNFKRMQIIKHK
jgi:nucleoside-diphosphate-sugar epimerase